MEGIVAVVAGLVVFYTVVKYGFRAVQEMEWNEQRNEQFELDKSRWSGAKSGN